MWGDCDDIGTLPPPAAEVLASNLRATYPVLEHPHFTSDGFPGAEDSISYHWDDKPAAPRSRGGRGSSKKV